MAATTITRSTWTDDSGSGITGSIVDNAELQKVYDNIDALFSGASTFELGGAVKVDGALTVIGTSTVAAVNASGPFMTTGTNPGGWATAQRVVIDTATSTARVFSYGVDASTVGLFELRLLKGDGTGSITPLAVSSTGVKVNGFTQSNPEALNVLSTSDGTGIRLYQNVTTVGDYSINIKSSNGAFQIDETGVANRLTIDKTTGFLTIRKNIGVNTTPLADRVIGIAGSINTVAGAAFCMTVNTTIVATANNDVGYYGYVGGGFTPGGFTGTTAYGVYVAPINQAATNYALYTNAGLVYHADNTFIAKTSAGAETLPLTLTNVSNTTNTAVGIAFSPHTANDVMGKITSTVGAGTDYYMAFSTVGPTSGTLSEKMRLSGDGHLTLTSQPGFLAYASTTQTFSGAPTTVSFTTVLVDDASNYSGGNTFTAPTTGNYLFACMIVFLAGSSGPIFQLVTTHYTYQINCNTDQANQGFSVVAYMTAGDTAKIVASSYTTLAVQYDASILLTWFSGRLLS